jgi:hypothetical protein
MFCMHAASKCALLACPFWWHAWHWRQALQNCKCSAVSWVKCKAHPLLPVLLIVICSRSPVTTKITCERETCSAPGDSVIPSRPVCASLAKAPACCTRPWEREGRSILWGAGRQKGCADTLICSLTLVKLPFFLSFSGKMQQYQLTLRIWQIYPGRWCSLCLPPPRM